ncbi:MAG: NAD(+) synthase [Deltaproteobacteria bacterium]|nr:NAD(+) synthase [Deltaproteobacteria bacterium]
MHPRTAHVAAATLNQTVGDWTGNARRIREVLDLARARGVRLIGFPEMCIPGYSLGDRLLMAGTVERSWATLMRLVPHTHGMIAALGLPVRHKGVLFNAVAVVADGKIAGLVCKENLATGDLEYESRWFSGWSRGDIEVYTAADGTEIPIGAMLFDASGMGRFAVEICEDGWKGLRPGSVYALAGAHIVVNPSASWFVLGKQAVRRRMVQQISREDHSVYVYTSLLGCDATRLVFDGASFIASAGQLHREGRRFLFREEYELIDQIVDLGALEHHRVEEGSFRQQAEALKAGHFGPVPPTIKIAGDFRTDAPPEAPIPYWTRGLQDEPPDPSLTWLHEAGLLRRPLERRDIPHIELELTLAIGLREYLAKAHIPGVALALSGGRDSAMVALLLHRMWRYDNPDLDEEALAALVHDRFLTAYMGTDHSSSATREAARAIAEELGATHYDGAIQGAVQEHRRILAEMTGVELSWEEPTHDIPLQNLQARLRGSMIWLMANLRGFLLVATSNKSEAAVGYATMDGDTSGGLSPIADVPKSLVNLWLRWARDMHGYHAVDSVLSTPATAELRPPDQGQTDEDDLMPFFILDQLMEQVVQCGRDPLDVFKVLWPSLKDHYREDPRAFAAHIRKFIRLLVGAQWKRERFAISFRVTAFDLDPSTGFRFPPIQAPFTEELADLDAYVATLAG